MVVARETGELPNLKLKRFPAAQPFLFSVMVGISALFLFGPWLSDALIRYGFAIFSPVAILAPFCVLRGVAVGAIAGGTGGDPENAEANLYSAIDAANADDTADTWRAMLQSSLELEGRQHGKTIVQFPEGESHYLFGKDLHWTKEGRDQ